MGTGEQMSTAERVETPTPVGSDEPPARSRRRWMVVAVVVLLTAIVGGGLLAAGLWGADLRERGLLLPGTVIAGVDVGLMSTEGAVEAVGDATGVVLDHEVELQADGLLWTVDARTLGADTDAEVLVGSAYEATADASLLELVGLRWFGTTVDIELDPTVTIPERSLDGLVASLAGEVDREPIDATIGWDAGQVVVTDSAPGFTLEQEPAVELVRDALLEQVPGPIELPFVVPIPEVGDELVQAARSGAEAALDRALQHEVGLRHDEASWTTSPAQLGAVPDGGSLVEEALQLARVGGDLAGLGVALSVPDEAVGGLLDEIAGQLNVSAVNASVDWSGGTVRRLAGREGRTLDRDRAATDLHAALQGEAEDVVLGFSTIRAARDVSDVHDVLVVHQSQRLVELYRGDEVIRSWPVAVGTGGSPTPTGTFVVGAKRYEPTWVNPAPDRWGEDMPARIGPGPDNPLGLRALNWNRLGGGDTLIRFHGTPNEASIGEAASNGCVRMFNDDVIDLYGLVSSGTMIISRA